MGLDVQAFRNVIKIDDPKVSEADDLCKIYHGHFPEQCGDLEDGDYYDGESQWFCRLSYGSYSRFRDLLAKIGGWPKHETPKPEYSDPDYMNKNYFYRCPYVASLYHTGKDSVEGPFVEILIFSDCEGFICAEICKKLFKDFEKFKPNAEEEFKDSPLFMEFYNGMMDAFLYGSQNGFVRYT